MRGRKADGKLQIGIDLVIDMLAAMSDIVYDNYLSSVLQQFMVFRSSLLVEIITEQLPCTKLVDFRSSAGL